jgi:hypothetical protein
MNLKSITAGLTLLTTLSAPAFGDVDLDAPSALDRYEAREREIDSGYGYSRGRTDVVVPIPPSETGPSYYSPNAIRTDRQYCVRDQFGTMTCQAH